MHIIVVLHNGTRITVEIENSDLVSTLKEEISQHLPLPLAFNSQELEDDKPLSYYKIRPESVVHVTVKQAGYSIPMNKVINNSDKETFLKRTNWEIDTEKRKFFVSFRPITKKSRIPFYDEVTQQPYHEEFNEEDRKWIRRYTGSSYKKLKVQSYILNPDNKQLNFLKKTLFGLLGGRSAQFT